MSMSDGTQADGPQVAAAASAKKRNIRKLVLASGALVALAAVGATYVFLVPAVADTASHPAAQAPATPEAAQQRPRIVDVPEIVVTLPNGGRARQLRIKLSLELTLGPHDLPPPEQLTPQINDAL